MEIVGWITIVLLCALALGFIILELGPVISTEISSWKIRKQKSLEAKEDKLRFKKEMEEFKLKIKKLKYMKKNGLDTSAIEMGMESLSMGEEAIEEDIEINVEEDNKIEKEIEIIEEKPIEENLISNEKESLDIRFDFSNNMEYESLSQEPIIIEESENSSEDSSIAVEEIKEETSSNIKDEPLRSKKD